MKVIIWGIGFFAQKLLENGINGEITGFVETVKSREEWRGYPVYGIDEIPDGYDYIIVANTYSSEIYQACLQQNIDLSKVVFIKRGDHVGFNADKRIREVLGEKNYTQYAAAFGRWRNTFVEDDMRQYSRMNQRPEFAIKEEYLRPFASDKYETNSGMNVYFWQDLWAAKHIISRGVKEHFDIGSRVDGFIAHLLAADIRVNVIDIRPFPGKADNLFTVVDDATMLKNLDNDSVMSLSALCSLEHFGLGRYGDPVDPEACFKCFAQMQKKLKKGGRLYISVPVGQDRVEFNAHRVFKAHTVISCFEHLKLLEYSVIKDRKIKENVDIHKYDGWDKEHVTGLFLFEKAEDTIK